MVRKLKMGWVGRHKIISALLILAATILGVLIYQAVALRINKHNFEQARMAIDTVYADIVAKVGQPDNYRRSSNCNRTYEEFSGLGSTSCDVNVNFIYGVQDKNQANDFFKKIQTIIANHKYFQYDRPPSSEITSRLVVNTHYYDAQDFYKITELKCTSKYVYDTPNETYLKFTTASNLKPLYITLGCYGGAKQPYYPESP